jgi:PAS domain S-box-containing protein
LTSVNTEPQDVPDKSSAAGAAHDIPGHDPSEAGQSYLLGGVSAADERFRALLEAIPDPIVVSDREGRVVLVNRQAETVFGYERSELLGRSVDILVPARMRSIQTTHRARYVEAPTSRPMGVGLELYGRRKDGSEFPVEVNISPVEAEGELLIIADIRDITQRKRAEAERTELLAREQTARAETEQLKDEFFASISHDLRTPAAAIKASIEVVLANEPPGMPEPLHRLLVNVSLAADRMTQLVADLLELTRLQSGRVRLQPERCDVRELARRSAESIQSLAVTRGQLVEVALPARAIWLAADETRLERALLNLLGNACKYGREGGTIRLSLERRRARSGRVAEAVFAVADDGPGVPEDEQSRIFERFYRSRTSQGVQGSGLGLTIARAMVELHGGRIWVESTLGQGATFRISVPIHSHGR